MADGARGAPSGVGSALVLILLLTGIAIWQFPLESIRPPASRATPVDRIAALQDIPARLWQDPFVVTKAKTDKALPGRRPSGVKEIIDEYRRVHAGDMGSVELLGSWSTAGARRTTPRTGCAPATPWSRASSPPSSP